LWKRPPPAHGCHCSQSSHLHLSAEDRHLAPGSAAQCQPALGSPHYWLWAAVFPLLSLLFNPSARFGHVQLSTELRGEACPKLSMEPSAAESTRERNPSSSHTKHNHWPLPAPGDPRRVPPLPASHEPTPNAKRCPRAKKEAVSKPILPCNKRGKSSSSLLILLCLLLESKAFLYECVKELKKSSRTSKELF